MYCQCLKYLLVFCRSMKDMAVSLSVSEPSMEVKGQSLNNQRSLLLFSRLAVVTAITPVLSDFSLQALPGLLLAKQSLAANQ